MAIANGSVTNAKSKGESGQPCLVPRFKGKIEEDTPLARTEHTGEEYKSFIQDMFFRVSVAFLKLDNHISVLKSHTDKQYLNQFFHYEVS